jgi:hypothetical protein
MITPLFSGGQIALVSNSSDLEQFCTESIDPDITSISDAAGGDTPFAYQWEQSTDGTSWTDISGATSLSYNPSVVNATTYFRRKVTDFGGAVSYSNEITLEKFAFTAHPSTTDQFLAPGGSITSLTVSHTSSSSAVTYQWYKNATPSNTALPQVRILLIIVPLTNSIITQY